MPALPSEYARGLSKLRRTAIAVMGLIFVLVCVGAGYQAVGGWRDSHRFPRRGRSIQVGRLKLNLNCTGAGSPTAILESGGGMSSIGWVPIQPEIAKYARVCSYDRAGYGWSDPGPEPRTALQIAKDLKSLLDAAGERGPFVLVGASLGGMYVRVYAGMYPGDVAGVVLVDATHEAMQDRIDSVLPPAAREQRIGDEERALRNAKRNRIIEWAKFYLGIDRLQTALGSDTPPFHLPSRFWEEMLFLDQQIKTDFASDSEMAALSETNAEARSAGNLGDRPLIVLTAGRIIFGPNRLLTDEDRDRIRAVLRELQAEEVRLSTHGKQIVLPDSGHVIQFERPDAVISAVHEVWSAARATPRVFPEITH